MIDQQIISESVASTSNSLRPSFCQLLGKVAFKNLYSKWPSKTSFINFFSEITTVYSSILPSKEEMQYAAAVFENEYRVKQFFRDNFCVFSVNEYVISDQSSVFYIDPIDFFEKLLANCIVRSSIEFQSQKNNMSTPVEIFSSAPPGVQ